MCEEIYVKIMSQTFKKNIMNKKIEIEEAKNNWLFL